MRNLYRITSLAFALLLSACSSMPFNSKVNILEEEEMAVLTDYELKNGFITIKAVGNGCTFFDSFRVEVADKADNAIKVVRTRPDECNMSSRNVSLQYSFKHLGLDLDKKVQVNNPVQSEENRNVSLN